MSKFLKATLDDGSVVISEFSKLGQVGRYVAQVMAGAKAFNVWEIVGNTHPGNGLPCLMRRRRLLAGRFIREIVEVQPRVGVATEAMHTMDPAYFEPVVEVQKGLYGTWLAPSDGSVPDVTPGLAYPIQREATTLRRYITTNAQVQHYLDPEGGPVVEEASTGYSEPEYDDDAQF